MGRRVGHEVVAADKTDDCPVMLFDRHHLVPVITVIFVRTGTEVGGD